MFPCRKRFKRSWLRGVVIQLLDDDCSEATAYDVVNQAVTCPQSVGLKFTVQQHHPEIKMLAEMSKKDK